MSQQEKDCLELFKRKSEEQLGWGDSENWNNSDFERLSAMIFERTGINLSISTLKRVWGKVKYDSVPTATTLNTLAQFSGYESWRSFCSQKQVSVRMQEPVVTDTADIEPFKKNPRAKWFVLVMLLPVLSSVIFLLMERGRSQPYAIDTSRIIFKSNVVSDELPNSVVFNYDIGDIKTDSVFIQQSWDPDRRERVAAGEHQHTSIYYFPGFFKAKLLIGKRIVKQHEIFIKTKGWMGIVQQQSQPQTKPIYLSPEEIKSPDGGMEVTAKTLSSKIGTSVFNDVWTVFCNAKEYNVAPSHFTFSATLQNTSAKEAAICRQVKVNIITTEGIISLPLCAKGCISDIAVRVGDTFIDGKDHDLSAFGYDFSKPADIKVNVGKQKADIFINDKEVRSVTCTKPFGRVVNLMIIFEGTGMARNISIQ